jgi:hypothetical protein
VPARALETRAKPRRGGDIAYLLGNDRGKAWIKDDLAQFPALAANLDKARKILGDAPRTDDLYTAWLDALRALAARPSGAVPSFMDTDAFADFRVNTTLAGFAQLRHNYVLIAGQAYGEGGCEIPDGYVEPAPAVYDALARYADSGAAKPGTRDEANSSFPEPVSPSSRPVATVSAT